ncbi:MAG: response regulator transcription factor [Elusimicrobia bacterium]|nr:response regulator transcription factor [Elusimicrobiota bacterium]
MTRVLVVEDDPRLAKLLEGDLELEGYKVDVARDGLEGLEKAKRGKPDIILLDVMLPKMNGYDVCRAIRKDDVDTPILFLTAKGQESEKVVGFSLGADDYVVKPFSGMELMARIKALCAAANGRPKKVTAVEFDGVRVDFKRMEAVRGKKRPGVDAEGISDPRAPRAPQRRGGFAAKTARGRLGYDALPSTRTVDNQVLTLRQKLGGKDKDAHIVTVHGVGYKFVGL